MNMDQHSSQDTILNVALITAGLVVLLVALVNGPAREIATVVQAVMVA